MPNNRLTGVEWLDTTPLLDRSGAPFPPLSPDATPPVIPPDPEGIAFDERRQQLYWSSEGERIVKDPNRPLLLDPWVRVAGLDGAFRSQFALPPMLSMSQQDTGARANNGLEGLTLTPSGNFLFAGMEDPGFNDGSLPTADAGALTRITRFDVSTGTATAQYAYPLDPITAPNGEANGLSDLVALDDDNFLVIERSHGTHNVARIYRASIAGADNILGRPVTCGCTADSDDQEPGRRPVDDAPGSESGQRRGNHVGSQAAGRQAGRGARHRRQLFGRADDAVLRVRAFSDFGAQTFAQRLLRAEIASSSVSLPTVIAVASLTSSSSSSSSMPVRCERVSASTPAASNTAPAPTQ